MIVSLVVVLILANGVTVKGDRAVATLEECVDSIKGFSTLQRWQGIKIKTVVAGCSINHGDPI